MNEHIRNYLVSIISQEYNESPDIIDEESIIEYIECKKVLYKSPIGNFRWWQEYFYVIEVGGLLIGYDWAETTGDMNAKEVGWEFDPSSICLVELKEEVKVVQTYKSVLEDDRIIELLNL